MKLAALLIAVMLGAVGIARADDGVPPPVQVRVKAEPSAVTIGQRFRFVVETQVQPGYELILNQPSGKIDDFDLIDFGELPRETRGADKLITRWFLLASYTTGQKVLNAPAVKYRRPNEEPIDGPVAHTVVTVESVLEKEPNAADIRDIRGPEAVPIDWRPFQVGGGVLAVLALVAAIAWRLIRGRHRVLAGPPPIPAHIVARDALAALAREGLIERGEFKTYYSSLSAIVRAYLEGRFGLRAPEMTTEEFLLATSRGGQLDRAHRQLLGDFMVESDLVKFARHLPALSDAERALTAAGRFVDETAPRAEETDRAAG